MSVAVIDTPGLTTSNAFASVAFVDGFLASRMYATAWSGQADPDVKAQALITATDILCRFGYHGYKVSNLQALAFPRYEVYDEDGWVLDSATVPLCVQRATALLALELLKAGTTTNPFDVAAQDDLKRLAVDGAVSLEFRSREERATGLNRYPDVKRELRSVLKSFGPSQLVRA